jgi:hypothetical protein
MFCYSSIYRNSVFTKVVQKRKGRVVDISGIMFIFKTVMYCIIFNLLDVYCRYMKLKLLTFLLQWCLILVSIIGLFDFCHVKCTHIFCFVFSIHIFVRVCHIITTIGCTHIHVWHFMSNMNMDCEVVWSKWMLEMTIRLLWCHQYIPLTKYSSIHNMYVYLLQHCIIDFLSHRCSISPAIWWVRWTTSVFF